ncbi:MAG TPA: hypothetical protein VMD05_02140 [Candidatus Nanoarchaeia archaeon]|nr:hypothetical protein [Candidatus Nanoarchaeia archaeon]
MNRQNGLTLKFVATPRILSNKRPDHLPPKTVPHTFTNPFIDPVGSMVVNWGQTALTKTNLLQTPKD